MRRTHHTRSVQYWHLTDVDGKPLPGEFPARAVVQCLLDADSRGADRHRVCRDGMVLIAHGDDHDGQPMIVLDKVRRENLPSVGDLRGVRRPIGLTQEEGLLEPTYCMFAKNNIVATLLSGNGPRPNRLIDYLAAKLGIEVDLEPVLTHNLDQVLRELRVSAVDVAVPADRVGRGLVGGDWAGALDAGSKLVQSGVVRVGFSVGREGTAHEKSQIRLRLHRLIDQLRRSGDLSAFLSARVTGSLNGTLQTVDLLNEMFVEKTEVDVDRLNDPVKSTRYAASLIQASLQNNSDYLASVVTAVGDEKMPFANQLIENPDDQRT